MRREDQCIIVNTFISRADSAFNEAIVSSLFSTGILPIYSREEG